MKNFEDGYNVLCIEHMKKKYGEREILRDINLTVQSGEMVVITGKSGCGKSTLLNMIGLLDEFDSGKYTLNDINLVSDKDVRRKLRAENIGFVFQSYCLMEQLSVKDNILLPFLYSEKEIREDAKPDMEYINILRQYLSNFHMENLENVKCKFLSGGEKQRVAIIRALIRNPQIVVADEPTGNLDPENTHEIFDMFSDVASEGKIVIIVTHNQDFFRCADKCLQMKEGVLHEL